MFTNNTCSAGERCGAGCYCLSTNAGKCVGCTCHKDGATGFWC